VTPLAVEPRWQFWIDVGGTFTDCIARAPTGSVVDDQRELPPLRRLKLLSSAVTKVTAGHRSTRQSLTTGRREPVNFWRGYQLRHLDPAGKTRSEVTVAASSPEDGRFELVTALSHAPDAGDLFELISDEEAPILAIRRVLELRRDQPIPSISLRLGTTRGTNALLTRTGAKTGLIATAGLGDFLTIGYQDRPKLFELAISKPAPLFSETVEIHERVSADGQVLIAADEQQIRDVLSGLRAKGVESLAICLMNAYRNDCHERLVERVARELGFTDVSRSCQVSPLIKLVSRGHTTVVDAYLNPVLRDYGRRLESSLGADSEVRLLTSAGGLVPADKFSGKDSILSGPAGGVVGYSRVALAAGFERAIGFDMGGTSSDVSRFDGAFELEFETKKAGIQIVAPTLAIETVAAGGGSVCWFDGVKLCVGPRSAGADPGPACYGCGGPLTITDVNLVLGKIVSDSFPFPPDVDAAHHQLAELSRIVSRATGQTLTPIEVADGLLRVANANMSQAIRSISIAKGYDPQEYVLVAFGGAAPQHACAIAQELRIPQILNHPDAGILSAFGAGMADVRRYRTAGVYQAYSEETIGELQTVFATLAHDARREVIDEGIDDDQIEVVPSLDMRYLGTDAFLRVIVNDHETYADAFTAAYHRLYGYEQQGRELEIVAARVEVVGRSETTVPATRPCEPTRLPVADSERTVYFDATPHTTAVYRRETLRPGDQVTGPAIVLEPVATTVIDPGWRADVLSGGELLLHQVERDQVTAEIDDGTKSTSAAVLKDDASPVVIVSHDTQSDDTQSDDSELSADPIMLEIFNNHFAGIAEQLGITLRNSASSVNVK